MKVSELMEKKMEIGGNYFEMKNVSDGVPLKMRVVVDSKGSRPIRPLTLFFMKNEADLGFQHLANYFDETRLKDFFNFGVNSFLILETARDDGEEYIQYFQEGEAKIPGKPMLYKREIIASRIMLSLKESSLLDFSVTGEGKRDNPFSVSL